MKKYVIAFFVLLVLGVNLFSYVGKDYVKANEFTVIPEEAIRLRILANSDSEEDQTLKRTVRDKVNAHITEWVQDLRTIEEGRNVIKNRLKDIRKIVVRTVQEAGYTYSSTVQFDENVVFPTKMYGNFVYPAGEYEAILITIGEAKGANWWCVLFPPLCFLDFSNGEAVLDAEASEIEEVEVEEDSQEQQMEKEAIIRDEEPEEVEVRFLLKELFNAFFE
jgi:stage II sporulation protein R